MANIFLKYPNATSPTSTVEFTENRPQFPVPAREHVKQVFVTTMGGKTYGSRKSPFMKRITYHFEAVPDGDAGADYLGLLNFWETAIEGGMRAFDFVDQDGEITTVRMLNNPQSGRWQITSGLRRRATLEMEEVV